MSVSPSANLIFFLGGRDLEMQTIRELLEKAAPGRFFDKGLAWGAKTSDYKAEIEACLARGAVPVFIELQDDLGLAPPRVIFVDHHGAQAGADRSCSLRQVFDLLGLPAEQWTRRHALVAANDTGYIHALQSAGASRAEIAEIRAADRAAQGITPEEEAAAEQAVRQAEVLSGGALMVVRFPHRRTAAVADRLQPELGGPGYKNLLVISPGEVNFFGSGPLVLALDKAFPGGWYGGALPERGFWGYSGSADDIVLYLQDALRAS